MTCKTFRLFDRDLLWPAVRESFIKLSPAVQWRNPVMFVVYVGSILTTLLCVQAFVAINFVVKIGYASEVIWVSVKK